MEERVRKMSEKALAMLKHMRKQIFGQPARNVEVRGAGNEAAGERSLEILKFAGDALFTDSATIGTLLRSPNRRSARSEPGGRQ